MTDNVQELAESRARRLVVLVALTGAAFLVMAWQSLFSRLPAVTVGVLLAVGLLTALQWLSWFTVLYVRVVDARRNRFPRSAWWWAWFVPGGYVAIPKMLVNDVWRSGDPRGAGTRAPWQVQAWWVLWVGAHFLRSLGVAAAGYADDGTPAWYRAVLLAFVVAETALAIATVRILTRRIAAVIPALPPEAAVPVPA